MLNTAKQCYGKGAQHWKGNWSLLWQSHPHVCLLPRAGKWSLMLFINCCRLAQATDGSKPRQRKPGAGGAVGSSGEILYFVHHCWPFPCAPSGDGEVLSFAVTQEPWAGVAVIYGLVACFAKTPLLWCPSQILSWKIEWDAFLQQFQMRRVFLAAHYRRLSASQGMLSFLWSAKGFPECINYNNNV